MAVEHQIELFVSSISSSIKLRNAHDTARRCLTGLPVTEHDISSDEQAKALWKRKSHGMSDMPLILVDGNRPGSIEQLDEAVEFGERDQFLGLDRPAKQADDDVANLTEEDASKLLAELEDNKEATGLHPLVTEAAKQA